MVVANHILGGSVVAMAINQPTSIPYLTEFHRKTQWRERPWGIYIEAGGFLLGSIILAQYLM